MCIMPVASGATDEVAGGGDAFTLQAVGTDPMLDDLTVAILSRS